MARSETQKRPRRRGSRRRTPAGPRPEAPASLAELPPVPEATTPPEPPAAPAELAPPAAAPEAATPAPAAVTAAPGETAPPPESPGLEPSSPEAPPPAALPEPEFARRVPPPEPERPLPAQRRAIFFDVENTSRAEHIARVIDHLAVDRRDRRTDFVAVGNWRVIGADTARLLARHGAQLIHSAPSTGVRDWSDLRIAVSAGVWLAGARPGDVVEIVSDDRAFDAVGDVAAALGITFRRLSSRALALGAAAEEEEVPAEARPARGRRSRRRGRGGARPHHAAATHDRRHEERREERRHEPHRDGGAGEAHTAPHDELIHVVRELVDRGGGRPVLIDTLAQALKERGFRRTPGSPRLITRLRRIKELSVSPTGMISLVEGAAGDGREPAAARPEPMEAAAPAGEEAPAPAEGAPEAHRRRRRRSRRGGRRRRGGHAAGASGASPAGQ